MTYIRRTIVAGTKCYITEHAAPAYGKNKRRPPPQNPTSESQEFLNDLHAMKKLQLKILTNFKAKKDLFVTLTHAAGTQEADAKKQIARFLSQMRTYYKKLDRDFKYILITEKQGQWHHHLILESIPLEKLREFWGELRITISILSLFDDYKSLAAYLVGIDLSSKSKKDDKAPRKRGARRWSCSKNLKDPDIYEQEIKRISSGTPKPTKGWQLITWSKWCDSFGELHAVYECNWIGQGKPKVRGKRKAVNRKKKE